MPTPYRPMRLCPTTRPPTGDDWAHEAKLDGWRCLAEVTASGRVRLWSRTGKEWSGYLPEMAALAKLGDVVLDGELVVATDSGRADFDLLTQRMNARRPDRSAPPVTLYAFDVLRLGDRDVTDLSWRDRRSILEDLDVPGRSDGAARIVTWSGDEAAMHLATAAVMAEGTVSKRLSSRYMAGRSRHWLKSKHKVVETLQVAGWRPSTLSRPGRLIVAENDEPIAVAKLAVPGSGTGGADRSASTVRASASHRQRDHPCRLDRRHGPIHLPHPHSRPPPGRRCGQHPPLGQRSRGSRHDLRRTGPPRRSEGVGR